MAIRSVLKMIQKREAALAKRAPSPTFKPIKQLNEYDARNADEAMLLLGIAVPDPNWSGPCPYGKRIKLATWATQLALGRPGRPKLSDRDKDEVRRCTINPDQLKWPRERGGH